MDRVFFYVLWSVSPKLLFVIFVVVITLFFPHYAEAGALSKATSLTTGLIGCWDFDGPNVTSTTVTDCSGNGRNGTRTGGPIVTRGKVGQAMEFDKVDDKVQTGTLSAPTVFTIAAWIYPRSIGEGANPQGVIWSTIDTSDNKPNAQFRTRTTNNWFDLLIVFDNGGLSIGEWHTNASTVLLNEWQHVAVTFDASSPANDPLIYINGVSQTVAQEDAPSGTFPTATAPWVIGNVSNQQATFDGYLDEVRLYDRILTPEEVELLYRMGQ